VSDADLVRAAARNHRSWFAAGRRVVRTRGLTWIEPPGGGEAVLPFPRRASRPALDAVVDRCRARDLAGIGCWATGLEPTAELAARLVARGFEWGWQPHWMAIEIGRLPLGRHDPQIELSRDAARTWRALARVDGEIAGQAWAHVSGATAGVYDVDVVPKRRRLGLGRALTLAVCRAAAAAGARVATLNATPDGELLYGALGFRSLGLGQTWWIHRAGLRERPGRELVVLAEAAGRGDVRALARRAPSPELLAARLPGNCRSLAEIALDAGHPPAAEWLTRAAAG
jgi:ribosomal protein S18 acetylase RimI-like enzyme